jgi:hypothetical protein
MRTDNKCGLHLANPGDGTCENYDYDDIYSSVEKIPAYKMDFLRRPISLLP